jgi:hypothetical protein
MFYKDSNSIYIYIYILNTSEEETIQVLCNILAEFGIPIFTFAYTIFRCVNQLNVKVLVISVRIQLYNLQVFLFCH